MAGKAPGLTRLFSSGWWQGWEGFRKDQDKSGVPFSTSWFAGEQREFGLALCLWVGCVNPAVLLFSEGA